MKSFHKFKLFLTLTLLFLAASTITIPIFNTSMRAHAQGTVSITEVPVPMSNFNLVGITAGPDGNLWFIEQGPNKIGRITPAGAITEFPVPTANSGHSDITAGPDGNLWFTEGNPNFPTNQIGRITPSGVISEFPLPFGGSNLEGITAGPDGNLWFTAREANKIGRITPAGVITMFPLPTPASFPKDITAGPDGNLWFTEPIGNGNEQIGRITPTGIITEFPVLPAGARNLEGITAGPDGNLWFTEFSAQGSQIGRITPFGTITQFSVPTVNGQPESITAGPDGNLWFTEDNPTLTANQIGRITPDGVVTEFSTPTANSLPFDITAGPNGNLWFTENAASNIGRITFIQDTTPPILQLPSTITVNATSPQGTAVTYLASATDPDNASSQLTVSCTPASGGTFAIGTTTVSCRASDPAGNTTQGSFQVRVLGASDLTTKTMSMVDSFNLPHGIQNSFDSQLQAVLSELQANNTSQACSDLTSFMNHVEAQSGKNLTNDQANQLFVAATDIQHALGC